MHGIPSKEKFIQEGDIVSLDIGVIHKGYHSDAARTHAVGEISKEAALLIERTRQSFFEGMNMQPQENISMRYPEQSAVMQKVLDMGSCGIFVVMESERISMKNRIFRTLRNSEEE